MKLTYLLKTLAVTGLFTVGSISAQAEDSINKLKADAEVVIASITLSARTFRRPVSQTRIALADQRTRSIGNIVSQIVNELAQRDGAASRAQAIDVGVFAANLLRCSMNSKYEKSVSMPVRLEFNDAVRLISVGMIPSRPSSFLQRGTLIARAERVKGRISTSLAQLQRRLDSARGSRRVALTARIQELRTQRRAIDDAVSSMLTASASVCGS